MSNRVEQFKRKSAPTSGSSRVQQFKRQLQQKQTGQPVAASQPAQEEKHGFFKSIARGIVSPLVTSATRIGQSLAPLFGADVDKINNRTISTSLPGLGRFDVKPLNSAKQAVGESIQTAALGARNPIIGAGASALGLSLERNDSLKDTAINTAKGAAIGFGTRLVGKGLEKLSKPASTGLRTSAEKSMSKALGATTKTNKQLSDKVVPGLIERKTVALTRNSLFNKAQEQVLKVGDDLEEAYNKLPEGTRVNIKPVFDTLQNLKQKYVVQGTSKIGDEVGYKAVEDMQRKLLEVTDESVSVGSIRSFRQILDKATKRTGKAFALGDTDSAVAEARKATANAIRSELAKEFPEIGKINSEFNFWSNVQKVLDDTIQRTKAQTSLSGELAEETGAIVGATMKGTVGGVVLGAVTLKFLKQAVQSTAWRTTSALIKSSIANSLAKGDFSKAEILLQKIISASQQKD